MELAEALVERKAAQQKLAELHERLQRAAVVQEGERPAEEPAALLAELDEVAARLERLILSINRTNSRAALADRRTFTTAIARRDVLRMRQGATGALLRSVGSPQFRARGTEIKFVPTVSVPELQARRDALAKEYRELDTAIQAANWAINLVED